LEVPVLRLLIVVAILMILLYVVGGKAIRSIMVVDPDTGEVTGRKISYSPYPITFRDQYLCYSLEDGVWVMRGEDTGEECQGPFVESGSLCRALAEVGQQRVRLFWEGRVYECS
jgi:hypothetical protein